MILGVVKLAFVTRKIFGPYHRLLTNHSGLRCLRVSQAYNEAK